jgi:hypothetical protein
MLNYLLNLDVLNKTALKIIHYSLHQFNLRLSIFIGIRSSYDENYEYSRLEFQINS